MYDSKLGSSPPSYTVVPHISENKDEIINVGHPKDIDGDGRIDTSGFTFDEGIEVIDYNKDGRTDAFYISGGQFMVDFNIKQGSTFVRAGKPIRAFAPGIGGSVYASGKDAQIELWDDLIPSYIPR
ncbi:MAG: hypothetical protein U5M23_01010 [Marinagarivorans sp.]|nr:hypothetical protein [Marinagarivorans sp.]